MRNMNTPLGPGVAADRVIALRIARSEAIAFAVRAVSDRHAKLEKAILARVPEDQRAAALRMIDAVRPRIAENPGPELPSPRVVNPHDYTEEEHLAAVRVAQAVDPGPRGEPGEIIDAEYPEVDEEREPGSVDFVDDDRIDCYADGCKREAAAGSDFCAKHRLPSDDCAPPAMGPTADDEPPLPGWQRMSDGNWAPPRLAGQEPAPLEPGAITTVDEKPKRQRQARRA